MLQKFIGIILQYSRGMIRLFMWVVSMDFQKVFKKWFYNKLLRKLSYLKIEIKKSSHPLRNS